MFLAFLVFVAKLMGTAGWIIGWSILAVRIGRRFNLTKTELLLCAIWSSVFAIGLIVVTTFAK